MKIKITQWLRLRTCGGCGTHYLAAHWWQGWTGAPWPHCLCVAVSNFTVGKIVHEKEEDWWND